MRRSTGRRRGYFVVPSLRLKRHLAWWARVEARAGLPALSPDGRSLVPSPTLAELKYETEHELDRLGESFFDEIGPYDAAVVAARTAYDAASDRCRELEARGAGGAPDGAEPRTADVPLAGDIAARADGDAVAARRRRRSVQRQLAAAVAAVETAGQALDLAVQDRAEVAARHRRGAAAAMKFGYAAMEVYMSWNLRRRADAAALADASLPPIELPAWAIGDAGLPEPLRTQVRPRHAAPVASVDQVLSESSVVPLRADAGYAG